MITKIKAMYFSPTGTTEKIVKGMVKDIEKGVDAISAEINITPTPARKEKYIFNETEMLILGLPVYGGRIPVFLDGFLHNLRGENTPAVVISVYGNRDYDDALIEMKDILSECGFNVIAAGAFIGEHSFSSTLGANRPDNDDMIVVEKLSCSVIDKIIRINQGEKLEDFLVKGNYPYKERGPSTQAAPKTTPACTDCKICAEACPMEAISMDKPALVDDTKCIRCCACVKKCPVTAKYFDNEGVLKAKVFLEGNFMNRKEPELFV